MFFTHFLSVALLQIALLLVPIRFNRYTMASRSYYFISCKPLPIYICPVDHSPSLSLFLFVVMICLAFLCTFVRLGSAQPLLAAVSDNDQVRLENFLLNRYAGLSGRFANDEHHYPRLSHVNLDDVHLAKRIIMLPRVGRRSIPSASDA